MKQQTSHYLFRLQCCFDHEPALSALGVFHLQHTVAQVFTSHCHQALLALQRHTGSDDEKHRAALCDLLRRVSKLGRAKAYLVVDGD